MNIERPRYKLGSLFAGIGGFELGLERAIPGLETIWQVEQEPFCQRVLNKHWPNAQIYSDVREVGAHNLEPVDILCGGFPCQDISLANNKGEGLNGKKSGLWFEMGRLVCELRPRIVVMENVAAITIRGLDRVLGSLAEMGYDAEWGIISARDMGAPHLRKRWFCVAYLSNSMRERSRQAMYRRPPQDDSPGQKILGRRSPSCKKTLSHSDGTFAQRSQLPGGEKERSINAPGYTPWSKGYSGSEFLRMVDGISYRLDKNRLKALGNAIVPQCSELIGQYIANSGLLED